MTCYQELTTTHGTQHKTCLKCADEASRFDGRESEIDLMDPLLALGLPPEVADVFRRLDKDNPRR